MQKKFIKNLFVVQLLNLLVKASWILLIDLAVQNILGPDVYGAYYIILNFCLLFILLLDLGLNNFNSKNVAEDEQFIGNKKSILGIKLLLSLIYMSIVLTLGFLRDYNMLLLLFISGNQVVLSFVQYFRSNLAGMHLFLMDGIVGISDKLIALIICIVLFFSNNMNIEMFVAAQSFGLLSALLIGFTFNLTSITIKVKQQQHSIRHIIKEAFPFALLMALMALYTRIDAVMLDLLITDGTAKYHAGIYAQSFRLLDAGNIFALVLSGMLLPIFSRMIKQNESPKNMVNLSAKLVLIATLTVLLISFYFGYFIMSKLYHFKSEFEHLYSSTVLASLMIAFVAMSLVYVYGTLLTAANKIKKLNKIAAICLGINIILNYILIIEFDGVNRPAEGAAIATFVTQSMFVILCIRESFKLFKLEIQWKFLGKLLFYFVLLSSIYFYLIYLEYPIQIIFLIYISCGILFLFLFRLVDLKNTIALFKRE